MRRRIPRAVRLALALLVAARAARAAERVTLANGFDVSCHHHAIVDGRVRLYLNRDESSFVEVRPAEVASVEVVADPVMPAPAAQPSPSPNADLNPADLHEMLARAGNAHNVDVDLLASVVKAESDGNPHAVSHAGARGLMQLMPATAAEQGVADSFAPDQNVGGGSAYLDQLLARYHDNLALALAAYNAGPAAVDRYRGIPPYRETRLYVARVIHEFNRRVLAREAAAHAAWPAVAAAHSPAH